MLNSIGGFGTFLFFGVINICFIPFIWMFYPGILDHYPTPKLIKQIIFCVETKGRTLEELDVVFAKAYTTKDWYVKVAAELPKLSMSEIDAEANKWGIGGVISEKPDHQKDSMTPSLGGITDEGAATKV